MLTEVRNGISYLINQAWYRGMSIIQKNPDPLEDIVKNNRPNILVVTPQVVTIDEVLQGLREAYNLLVITEFSEAEGIIRERDFHLVISSPRFDGNTSAELARLMNERNPHSKLLVIGAETPEERAIAIQTLNQRPGDYREVRAPYDRATIEAKVVDAIGKSPPFPIIVGGYFCVGKSLFSSRLVRALNRRVYLAEELIPLKTRGIRAYERDKVDYIKISIRELEQLINEGRVIEYKHGEERNGIPLTFLDTLKRGRSVVIPTEINALEAVKNHFKVNPIGYRLISFLLYCSATDAKSRLFDKERYAPQQATPQQATPQQAIEIADDLIKLASEIEYYTKNEGKFRHVLRNDNLAGVSSEEAMSRLVGRALEIIRRESSPKYGALSDARFREVYVEDISGLLFGTNYKGILSSVRGGRPHQIPFEKQELVEYSGRYGIPLETVRLASNREVVAVTQGNGIYVLGLSPLPEGEIGKLYKKIFLDLLEAKLGVSQYREDTINLTSESHRFSLIRATTNQDFHASFTLYDPPKALPTNAPLHSLAFVGLSRYDRGVTLTPLEQSAASTVISTSLK